MGPLDRLPRLIIIVCTVVPYQPSYSTKSVGYVIKLGVILPYDEHFPWSMKKTRPAIEYAIDRIRNQKDLLPGCVFEILTGDSRCSEVFGPLVAIDFHFNHAVHLFLGPACHYSAAPIARFSYHWNVPIITGGALAHAFQAKRKYPLLTRVSGSYDKLGEFVSGLMDMFQWVAVGMVYTDNQGNSPEGRSECSFAMEGLYERLERKFKTKFPNKEIWRVILSERIKVHRSMELFRVLLERTSLNCRSKYGESN